MINSILYEKSHSLSILLSSGHIMICKFESGPLYLSYPVCASLEGSDEIECLCRFISAFALCLFDKYQNAPDLDYIWA